jgi:2,3-bisphosphoglycerate-dependent phosphoglycerate mutase
MFRHYGALQGLDKQQTVDKYGIDQVNIWRRSYDVPPPDCATDSTHYPANDRKYATAPGAATIKAESLKVIVT